MDQSLLSQLAGIAIGELVNHHASTGDPNAGNHAVTIASGLLKFATGDHSAANVTSTAISAAAAAFPQLQGLEQADKVVSAFPATIAEYDQGDAVVVPLTPTIRGHKALILIMQRDGRGAKAVLGD